MTGDQIRAINSTAQAKLAKLSVGQEAGLNSLQVSMLTEIAAQLAELNDRLKNLSVRHIPSDADPR